MERLFSYNENLYSVTLLVLLFSKSYVPLWSVWLKVIFMPKKVNFHYYNNQNSHSTFCVWKQLECLQCCWEDFVLNRGNFETDSEKNYCTSTVHGSAHLKRKILIIDVKKCGPRLFILWFNNVKCNKLLFFIYFIATQNKKITLEEKYIVKRKIIRCEISIIIIIIMICQSKTFVFYI